jgi:hypothetical protein
MRGGSPLTFKEKIAKFNALAQAPSSPGPQKRVARDSLELIKEKAAEKREMKEYLEKVNKEISALEKEEDLSEANILKIFKLANTYANIKNQDIENIENRLLKLKQKLMDKLKKSKKAPPPADAYVTLGPSPQAPSPPEQAPAAPAAPAQALTAREQKVLDMKRKRETEKQNEQNYISEVLNNLDNFLRTQSSPAQAPAPEQAPSPPAVKKSSPSPVKTSPEKVQMRKNKSGKKRSLNSSRIQQKMEKEREQNTKNFFESLKREQNTMRNNPVRGLHNSDTVHNPIFRPSP